MSMIPVTQNDIENAYSLLDAVRLMLTSSELGHGMTEKQLQHLSKNSGVPIEQFQHVFSVALMKCGA